VRCPKAVRAKSHSRMCNAGDARRKAGAKIDSNKYTKNMLKIFTLKYEERTESINDSVMSNFLADKEIPQWESLFFERKNEYF
jgi:hypothetical protein